MKLTALLVNRFLNAEFLILTINKLLVIPPSPHSTIMIRTQFLLSHDANGTGQNGQTQKEEAP